MPSNNSDCNDHASAMEQLSRDAAISDIRKLQQAPASFDGECCTVCGAGIPEGRLKAGRWTCIACQSKIESQQRKY